jgi:hypothetical protein
VVTVAKLIVDHALDVIVALALGYVAGRRRRR